MAEKPDVLLVGNKKPVIVNGLSPHVNLHVLFDAKDRDAFIKSLGDSLGMVRGVSGGAILGDGNVSMILDAPGVIDLATGGDRFAVRSTFRKTA